MNWTYILNEIFKLCIVPLFGLGTAVFIYYVKAKLGIAKSNAKSETAVHYLSVLEQTIIDCIKATNQTYVNSLKDKNAFDAEAQATALKHTASAVSQVLSDDVKENLTTLFGDLETLIVEKIEANIENAKK